LTFRGQKKKGREKYKHTSTSLHGKKNKQTASPAPSSLNLQVYLLYAAAAP